MTQTLSRARPRPVPTAVRTAGEESAVASVWLRGACAALWSTAVGAALLIVLVLGVWAADPRSGSSAGSAVRLALALWLVAQRATVHVPGGSVAVAPLGISLLLGCLLARAASIVARGSRCASAADISVVIAAVAVPYTVLTTAVALVARSSAVHPSVPAAVLAGLLMAGVAAGAGALRGSGRTRATWQLLPERVRFPAGGAAAALGVLLAASVVVTVASLATHAARLQSGLAAAGGLPAELSLALLCVALLPNAFGFAFGYVAGPGFALGTGSHVTWAGSHLASLPALPLLAAVPHHRAAAPVTAGCLALVVAAGAVAGWRAVRRPTSTAWQLQEVGVAGAMAGLAGAVLVAVAGGPAGPGRMSSVGPSPWQVGLAVTAEVALAGAVVVASAGWLRLALALRRSGASSVRA